MTRILHKNQAPWSGKNPASSKNAIDFSIYSVRVNENTRWIIEIGKIKISTVNARVEVNGIDLTLCVHCSNSDVRIMNNTASDSSCGVNDITSQLILRSRHSIYIADSEARSTLDTRED